MSDTLTERYHRLLDLVVTRRGEVDKFVQFLEKETSWLVSPASTRFHLAEERGLLKHSVGVCETLLRIKPVMHPDVSDESCAIVGLFHDVGKVGYPNNPLYTQPQPRRNRAGHSLHVQPQSDQDGAGRAQPVLIAQTFLCLKKKLRQSPITTGSTSRRTRSSPTTRNR